MKAEGGGVRVEGGRLEVEGERGRVERGRVRVEGGRIGMETRRKLTLRCSASFTSSAALASNSAFSLL